MTNEWWEDLGRDISNNTYLETLNIDEDALDDETLPSLFRGLSKSSSIIELGLKNNNFSETGLRSLEPFLQNSINLRGLNLSYTWIRTEGFNILWQALSANPIESLICSDCGITSIEIENLPNNLPELELSGNNIQSEGFNRLIRSLRDSSIEHLHCGNCSIESIDIDTDYFPRSLKTLYLGSDQYHGCNRINSNGCRGIAKLLQGDLLEKLRLEMNLIGDEGVAILVDALKTNTTLDLLCLNGNDGISRNGRIMMLELVNDMSSIKATLQSNHTLQTIRLGGIHDDIKFYINMAITTNRNDPIAAGREKVIQTQLHSMRRAELVEIQGVVSQSVYGEIDPLHLPEVLSLVGHRHGQGELYVALKASIAEVMSTVNRKRCIQQRIAYHASIIAKHKSVIAEHSAKQRELEEEIKTMEGEGESSVLAEQPRTKRRRK